MATADDMAKNSSDAALVKILTENAQSGKHAPDIVAAAKKEAIRRGLNPSKTYSAMDRGPRVGIISGSSVCTFDGAGRVEWSPLGTPEALFAMRPVSNSGTS